MKRSVGSAFYFRRLRYAGSVVIVRVLNSEDMGIEQAHLANGLLAASRAASLSL